MSCTCVSIDSPSVSLGFYLDILDPWYFSPSVRESKTLFNCGFHTFDFGSRYWIPAFVSGSWILNPVVSGILDSLGCIPYSKARNCRFYEQKLPVFRNSDWLTWGDILRSVPQCRTNYVSLKLRFQHSSINITSVNTLICPSLTLTYLKIPKISPSKYKRPPIR